MSSTDHRDVTGSPLAADSPSVSGHRPAGSDTASNRASFSDALGRLRSAQKPAKGTPAYSRFVNRRMGRFFAAAAYRLGMTPNGVTAVSAAFSFLGIAILALARPSWPVGVAVTLALVLGYALDSADGQLARLRGGGSASGEWLDHMIDATKISSLHLAVLISAFRFFELPNLWLLVPIAFTVVANVAFFGMILNEQLTRAHSAAPSESSAAGQADGGPSTLRSLLVLPTDYGVLCLIFLLLGSPITFFVAYSLLYAGSAAYLGLAVIKWFGIMKRLDPPHPAATARDIRNDS